MTTGGAVSRSDIIEELQRLEEIVDRQPTAQDMRDHGKYSPQTVYNKFNSWIEAREAADQPRESPNPRRIPEQELIAALESLADDLGHTPTRSEMDEKGKYSSASYTRAFGTWNNALIEAELESNKEISINKEDLLEEIRTIADQLNKVPAHYELDEYSKHSKTTYQRRFGSWSSAIEAAGLSPNVHGAPEGQEHHNWQGGANSLYTSVRNLLSEEQWSTIREREKEETCRHCGENQNLHLHHIIPIMSGGTNGKWNLMTLCQKCHSEIEWFTKSFAPAILNDEF